MVIGKVLAVAVALLGIGVLSNPALAQVGQPNGLVDLSLYYQAQLGLSSAGSSGAGSAEVSKPLLVALNAVPRVSSAQLSAMRGGFDLAPGLTINFGLEAVTAISQSGPSIVQDFSIAGRLAGSAITANLQTMNSNGQVTSAPLAGSDPIVLPMIANNGATTVITSLAAHGITTLIQNSQPNQLVRHIQTLNIDIGGLKQQLAEQTNIGMLSSALRRVNFNNHR